MVVHVVFFGFGGDLSQHSDWEPAMHQPTHIIDTADAHWQVVQNPMHSIFLLDNLLQHMNIAFLVYFSTKHFTTRIFLDNHFVR